VKKVLKQQKQQKAGGKKPSK